MTLVLAHRGSRLRAPENTMSAFARALDEHADGVELDVRTCRTGEVVVVHDATLWRVAGDAREIADLPLRELRAADVGNGERVPVLDEALDLVLGRDGVVNVEVKGDVPDRPGAARAIGRVLMGRSASDRERMILSTFDPLTFVALRAATKHIRLGFLFDGENTGLFRGLVIRRLLRPDAVHPGQSLATPRAIRRWKRRGLAVNVWTVNDPDRARALADAGVDGLITDDPVAIRAAISKHP